MQHALWASSSIAVQAAGPLRVLATDSIGCSAAAVSSHELFRHAREAVHGCRTASLVGLLRAGHSSTHPRWRAGGLQTAAQGTRGMPRALAASWASLCTLGVLPPQLADQVAARL